MSTEYDLVVIGGGSGGLECGWNAAMLYGKKVAVIDTQKVHGIKPDYAALGGTCVNVGCVPKKLMMTGALYREHMKDAAGFGWNVPDLVGDWKKLMEQKDKAVLDINKSYEGMFNDKLVFVQGFGRLAGPNKIEVMDTNDRTKVVSTLDAKNIVIATGAWPYNPPFEGIEHTISSNEAFYLPEAPKRPLVVGGGFIAVEFAGIFNGYKPKDGKVTLCYRGDLFLRGFDADLRASLATQMTAGGVNLMFNENPAKVELLPDGNKKVTFESGKTEIYDVVMIATGRKPKTTGMQLAENKVELNKNQGVVVNEKNATNVAGVYALGDVIDKVMLTPVAIHEGSILAGNLFNNEDRTPDYDKIPAAVFSIPPIGTVGLLEEDAAKKYANVNVYKSSFLPLMHQLTGFEHKRTLYKIITDADDENRILGVHMLGLEAPEVIQAVGICVKMGAKLKDFFSTIGVHPTSAEELVSMRTPEHAYKNGVKIVEEKKE